MVVAFLFDSNEALVREGSDHNSYHLFVVSVLFDQVVALLEAFLLCGGLVDPRQVQVEGDSHLVHVLDLTLAERGPCFHLILLRTVLFLHGPLHPGPHGVLHFIDQGVPGFVDICCLRGGTWSGRSR